MDIKHEMQTLSELEQYVDAELDKIILIKGLQEKMKAYQALENDIRTACEHGFEFLDEDDSEVEAENKLSFLATLLPDSYDTFTSMMSYFSMEQGMMPDQFNQMEKDVENRSQALFDKIGEVKKSQLELMLNQFTQLTQNFKQQMNQCSRVQNDTVISNGIKDLYIALGTARKALEDTGDLGQFKLDVNKAFEIFPDEVQLEINGTRTWFQRNVIRPFEQFKFDVGVLFESIFKKTPENHKNSPRFFNKPVHNAFETYQKDLENLADYEPPKPKQGG